MSPRGGAAHPWNKDADRRAEKREQAAPTIDLALPERERRRRPVSTADVAVLADVAPRTVQVWRARHGTDSEVPFPPVLPPRTGDDPRQAYHEYDQVVAWLRATSRYLMDAEEIARILGLEHAGAVTTLVGLGLLPRPTSEVDTPSGKRIPRWNEPAVRMRIVTEPLLADLRFGRATLNEVAATAREAQS